jgi:hypothetical protein
MSTLTLPTERIAAAGCARAAASPSYVGAVAVPAGFAASIADAFRGWGSNPTTGMQVKATKRHDLTPAPRPEEGSP